MTDVDQGQALTEWVRRFLATASGGNVFDSGIDRIARALITEALRLTGGNRSKAAQLLGLSRPTLHSKIEKYRLKIEASVREAE